MKSIAVAITTYVILAFNGAIVLAQEQSKMTSSIEDTTYLSVDMFYISDVVFMGRKDITTAPYLYTILGYHHMSGLYAEGSVSYLTKSGQGRIDLWLVSAGFEKDFGKLNTDFSATKYFFNDDSYNVISAVEADVSASILYDFDIISLGCSSSLYFSSDSSTDLLLFTQIRHDYITNNRKWQISPMLEFQFGSQQFYEQYFIEQDEKGHGTIGNGNGSGTGNGDGTGDGSTTNPIIQITESESFNLMAIELSLPIWYRLESFTFSFVPTYVIPSSTAEISVDEIVYKEELENSFYWMLGISYEF